MGCKFSIIIPVYNGEKYVQKALESCLCQTYSNYEIIVVNDGSTDQTEEILKRYSENNKIKVINVENGGLSVARNLGLTYAVGEFVLFLDADDWYDKTLLEDFVNDYQEEDLEVLFFAAQEVAEETGAITSQEVYKIDENRCYTGEEIFNRYRVYDFPHEAWRGIYKRTFLLNNQLFFLPGVLYEDNAFWFRVLKSAKKVRYIKKVYYNYLIRSGSIVHSKANERHVESVIELIKDILSVDNPTEAYLGSAVNKITVLIWSCEKRIKTIDVDEIRKNLGNLINEKEKLLCHIDYLYTEDTPDNLRMKYLLVANLVGFLGVYDEEMWLKVLDLRAKVINQVCEIMKIWPLNDDSKIIGLYGSGRNSDVILNMYEKLFGKIKATCFYVDSTIKSESQRHNNRLVINIDDLAKYQIQEVILCSNLYEESMYHTMQTKWPKTPVYRVYGKYDYSVEGIINRNSIELEMLLKKTGSKSRFILLHTPEYPNVGDHLIACAVNQFLKAYFPEKETIEITNDEYRYYNCRIKDLITNDDILVVTGGGFWGSLWTEGHYDEVLDVLEAYPQNEVWVFPQSVYFEKNNKGKVYEDISKQVLDRQRLKICVRERYSYDTVQRLNLKNATVSLVPDIAFFNSFNDDTEKREDKIGWFIRTDKESIMSSNEREKLREELKKHGMKIVESSMQYHSSILKGQREEVVSEKLREIATYKFVVTDQLHCMISCAITGTPCIAFNNVSKKVEGVYEWIKDLTYIQFTSELESISDVIESVNITRENSWNDKLKPYWEEVFLFLREG